MRELKGRQEDQKTDAVGLQDRRDLRPPSFNAARRVEVESRVKDDHDRNDNEEGAKISLQGDDLDGCVLEPPAAVAQVPGKTVGKN